MEMNPASADANELHLVPGARQMPRKRILLSCVVELPNVEERQRRALGRRAWMEVAALNAAPISVARSEDSRRKDWDAK